MLGGVLDNRHATQFSALDLVVARDEVNHLGAEACGQGFDQICFTVGVATVADQTGETNTTGGSVLDNTLGDVVCSVHGHHLTGDHDVDLLGLVLTNRHGEATADNVTEDIVEDEVEVGSVSTLFLEKVDRSDNATTGTTNAWLRASRLNAHDVAVSATTDIFQFEVLNRA